MSKFDDVPKYRSLRLCSILVVTRAIRLRKNPFWRTLTEPGRASPATDSDQRRDESCCRAQVVQPDQTVCRSPNRRHRHLLHRLRVNRRQLAACDGSRTIKRSCRTRPCVSALVPNGMKVPVRHGHSPRAGPRAASSAWKRSSRTASRRHGHRLRCGLRCRHSATGTVSGEPAGWPRGRDGKRAGNPRCVAHPPPRGKFPCGRSAVFPARTHEHGGVVGKIAVGDCYSQLTAHHHLGNLNPHFFPRVIMRVRTDWTNRG